MLQAAAPTGWRQEPDRNAETGAVSLRRARMIGHNHQDSGLFKVRIGDSLEVLVFGEEWVSIVAWIFHA